ncbi:MAG TPA: DUF308 domain-containing protein [Solirubrobacteraceae bacterium]|jgi:uncharacterized membrane protein HdeD (DUF308 family)|nr:DUF308 domain-containing protein [Solirubrobacteraceae bacterium]
MFVAPGTTPGLGQRLSRDVAQSIASNWWVLLLNGLLLIVAGVLIFSINWTVSSLSTFIGALFIFQGVSTALITGVDGAARRTNVVSGLLSIAAGVVIIAWPKPGLVALAIFLGAWLIVVGTISISSAFATRDILPNWWLVLILGLLEIPLGLLALADPGATLAAIITVGGIWGVAVGITRVVLAFEVKRLPNTVDNAWAEQANGGTTHPPVAHAAS